MYLWKLLKDGLESFKVSFKEILSKFKTLHFDLNILDKIFCPK